MRHRAEKSPNRLKGAPPRDRPHDLVHAFNVPLVEGQNWTQPYTFRINYTGLWKVQFLLFKDGDFSAAYRELYLFVRVQ